MESTENKETASAANGRFQLIDARAASVAVPFSVVQAEWDQTIRRVMEMAEVIDRSVEVSDRAHAHFRVKRTEQTNVEGIERVLFQNLLLAPRVRTMHPDRIEFGCEWLWKWRKAVPFKAEKIGAMSSLAPWVPRDQWTYRYNLIEVDQ